MGSEGLQSENIVVFALFYVLFENLILTRHSWKIISCILEIVLKITDSKYLHWLVNK